MKHEFLECEKKCITTVLENMVEYDLSVEETTRRLRQHRDALKHMWEQVDDKEDVYANYEPFEPGCEKTCTMVLNHIHENGWERPNRIKWLLDLTENSMKTYELLWWSSWTHWFYEDYDSLDEVWQRMKELNSKGILMHYQVKKGEEIITIPREELKGKEQ
jgi:DNA-binding Lrp family transcriptional regulator